MRTFIEQTVEEIDGQIQALERERELLESARGVLARDGLRASVAEARAHLSGKRGKRSAQALRLIRRNPGITSAELADKLKLKSSGYAYQLVKKLHSTEQIEPCEKGWKVA